MQVSILDIPRPTSSITEVLYCMLQKGVVSIKELPYLSGFRTRVSELANEHNLSIKTERKLDKNKYGKTYYYHEHSIQKIGINHALETYNKLIENGGK